MRRAAGCGRLLSRTASPPTGSGTAGCSWSGEWSGSPGWWSFPTPPAALSAGLSGGPSIPTGRPGSKRCPAPSRCLGLGVLGLRLLGRWSPRGSSTGLPLPGGASPPAPPSAPRAWSGSPQPCGAAPASSSPSTTTTRALRATERLAGLLGRRAAAVTLPQGVGDVAELAARPHGRAAFLRLLTRPPAPPASGSPPLPCGLPGPLHLSLTGLVPASSIPTLTTEEDLCPIHDGLRPHTASRRGIRIAHSL